MSIRTATVSSVASATSSTLLFAAVDPTSADQRIVVNDSTAVLYVKFGTAASSSSYTKQLAAGADWVFPVGPGGAIYTGVVHGIWASANGNARLTQAV